MKARLTSLFLFVLLAAPFAPAARAATTPSLGAAASYGVLANSYVNPVPGTTINGDVGFITGPAVVPAGSHPNYGSGAPYATAGADKSTALAALNSEPCTFTFGPGTIDFAADNSHGTMGVYTPGVYCITSTVAYATIGAAGITLSGSGTYIFRINGSLTTAAGSVVALANGASPCDVFWTIADNAITSTFGANSTFSGTVIDNTRLTIHNNVTWTGRALLFDGTVSTDVDDTITVPSSCLPPPPATGTLHVIKTFYNDYGGVAVPSDASVHVRSGAGDVAGSPQPGAVAPGTAYTLNADTYTVSEDAFSGYTAIFSGACDTSGHVTIAAGDDKTCTISNDQNPPSSSPGTLHVVKHVVNDNGGTAAAASFTLHVKNAGPFGLSDVAGSPAPGVETPGTAYSLAAGSYVVSEDAFSGYAASFSGDCDAGGNVTLASGNDKTCIITNNDIAPPSPGSAVLHVVKHVVNDNGGTAAASSFTLHVKGSGSFGLTDVTGSPAAGIEAPGRSYVLSAGTYAVSENAFSGYVASFSGDCDAGGNVALAAGDDKTCVITNDDAAPPQIGMANLHVIKHVVNDNGGTAAAASFTLHVKGAGSFGLTDVTGSPAAGSETPGRSYSLAAGTYVVSEDPFTGYSSSFSGDCDSGGAITLAAGNDRTCTITNNDTPTPSVPPATLRVVKIVVNDDGGTAAVSLAVMHVKSGLGDVAGSPQAGAGSPGTSYTLAPGTYNVSENFFAGYAVTVGGDCAANGDVALASGDSKTCTITNNDIPGVPHTTTITTTTTTSSPPSPCDICGKLAYEVYIVNPDLSERHSGTAWVRVTDRGNKVLRYSFEDKTLDPNDPNYDYNDAVVDVDFTDCKHIRFLFVSSDADWKHKIRFMVSIDGVKRSDTLVTNDSKAVVGTSKVIDGTVGINVSLACAAAPSLLGRILLQVQQHGEAWYVRPGSGLRYYMKDGPTAYGMMRNFGLGITDKDLESIPRVESVDMMKQSQSACSAGSAPNAVKGKILLQVQQHGEAWYVDAVKCRRIYMKDGAAAYALMRYLGLGITDADLAKVAIGQ